MKNSNLTLKIACYLIFAALLVWLGIYAYQALNDPYRTVPVTAMSRRETAQVRGIVARDEQVITSVYSAVSIDLGEGARVSAGGAVAEAFSSDEALHRALRRAELLAEAEELTALLADNGTENSRQMDEGIQAGIRSLRLSVSDGDFAGAETQAAALQTQVFAVFRSPDELMSRLSEVRAELQELESRYNDRGDLITAPISGLFSSSVDGWEDLSGKDLRSIDPAGLSALLEEERSAPAWALGKLVGGVKWYYALLIGEEDADALYGRNNLQVLFGRYYGEELTMHVERTGEAVDGQRVLLLSCSEALADIMGMRKQDAEILISEVSGLRIPRKGLHVDDKGNPFVYVQTALLAEKKPVRVLADYGDYYMVSSDTLRAGDEVIVSARNLYEGKVVG